jgi:hypothetical protein
MIYRRKLAHSLLPLSRILSRLLLFLLTEFHSLAISGLLWSLMIAAGSSLIAYPIALAFLRFRAFSLSLGVGLVVFGGLSLAHAWRRNQD